MTAIARRSRKKTAKWGLVFSYISQAQAFVLGIVLVPLYLVYIPLDQYGAWLATGNVLFWITLIDPGLNQVIKQRIGFAFGARDYRSILGYANSGLVISTLIALLIGAAGWLIAPYLGDLLRVDPGISGIIGDAFALAAVGAAFTFLSHGFSAITLGLQGTIGNGLVVTGSTFVYIGVILALLLQGFGLMALAAGLAVRGLVQVLGQLAYLCWRFRKESWPWQARLGSLNEMASLSLYTFSARFINGLNAHLNLFLASRYVSPEIVPLYALTGRVPKFFKSFLTNPVNVFVPIIAQMHGEGQHERLRSNLLRLARILIWTTVIFLFGFLSFNEPFIALWVGSELYAGDAINLLIGLNLVVSTFLYALTSTALSLGDIKKNNAVQLIQGILILICFYVGVRYYGIVGMLIGSMIPQILVGFVYYGHSLPGRIDMDGRIVVSLMLSILRATLLGVGLWWAISMLALKSWLLLVTMAGTYVVAYGLMLSVVDREARSELFIAFAYVRSLLGKRTEPQ